MTRPSPPAPLPPRRRLGARAPLRAAAALALALAGAPVPRAAAAEDPQGATSTTNWPLLVDNQDMELRVFRPHAVDLAGDRLTARAVISRALVGADGQLGEPAFGVAWLSSRADIDRDERTIALSDQEVTKITLAGLGDQDSARLSALIRDSLRERQPVLHLDRVLLAIQQHQAAKQEAARIGTTPPAILVAHAPSILVRIDGQPEEEPISGTHFARVVNSPFMLARDSQGGAYWLYHGGRWYTAPAITAAWRVVDQAPESVAALVPALTGFAPAGEVEAEGGPQGIVVSLVPAELIAFDGQPIWEAIAGCHLLAGTNTDRDVLRDPASGLNYVLLSGRWFASADLEAGPWRYVAPDQLPADFANIPAEGHWADLRAHVAGTTEAEEAVMDAHLPQTAAIPRDATTAVSYDGDPAWQSIQGTQLSYALNTDQEVIAAPGGVFYCCADGVWYVANSPAGPWTVSASTPPGIDTIPPDCPIYNVRYVQVYECTPEVCYCGYTAGYTGCYVVGGCPVWGTGFVYDPWWHHHYHPRCWTWGLGMSYDPRSCSWGSDVETRFGGSAGWFAFGLHGSAGRWWGPCGYRPVYIHTGRPGTGQILRERQLVPQQARARFDLAAQGSVYRGRARPTTPAPSTHHPQEPPARAPFASRPIAPGESFHSTPEGEVFRHGDQGWERWQGKAWEPAPGHEAAPSHAPERPIAPEEPVHRPAPAPERPTASPAPARGDWTPATRQELEGQRAQESRAEVRTQQFQRERASTAPVRSASPRDGRRLQ